MARIEDSTAPGLPGGHVLMGYDEQVTGTR
jgi:hypothetical protein